MRGNNILSVTNTFIIRTCGRPLVPNTSFSQLSMLLSSSLLVFQSCLSPVAFQIIFLFRLRGTVRHVWRTIGMCRRIRIRSSITVVILIIQSWYHGRFCIQVLFSDTLHVSTLAAFAICRPMVMICRYGTVSTILVTSLSLNRRNAGIIGRWTC